MCHSLHFVFFLSAMFSQFWYDMYFRATLGKFLLCKKRKTFLLSCPHPREEGGGGVHRRFGLESTTVFCKNTLAVQSGLFTCQAGKGRDLNSLKEANIAFGPQFNSDFTKLKHLMRIICVF